MITAVFVGGPLDGLVLALDGAPEVFELPVPGTRYELRPMGRAHVRYEHDGR